MRLLGPYCSSADRKFTLVPITSDADDVIDFTVTTSGQICVSAPLDFESKTEYYFYVVVDTDTSAAGTPRYRLISQTLYDI